MTAGLRLGAPGVYVSPLRARDTGFSPVRLDVAGFVGISLRGPIDEPVRVASWSDFQCRFGGPVDPSGEQCPGLLPSAVQVFFAQGGTAAWVARVAPPPSPTDPPGPPRDRPAALAATAAFDIGAGTARHRFVAADEGSWGNRLEIILEFVVAGQFRPPGPTAEDGALPVPEAVTLPSGSLLRLRGAGFGPAGALAWVTRTFSRARETGGQERLAVLTPPAPAAMVIQDVSVITGTLVVTDRDPLFARGERLTGLGLHPDHPRFPPRVLGTESLLIRTVGDWIEPIPPTSGLLLQIRGAQVNSGTDRWDGIGTRSFFDDAAAETDPIDEQPFHRGVDRMGRVAEIGLLSVPDLQWQWIPPEVIIEPPGPAGIPDCGAAGGREPDRAALTYVRPVPPSSRLDARDPGQLAQMVERQLRAVQVADFRRRFVLLLDVPEGLPVADITRWRAQFDTSYAAAYHPWLGIPGLRPLAPAVLIPPSVYACGITAARERRFGLPWGPANELAALAVTAADVITDTVHDQLHLLGVNVFRAERDGFRLTAARTVSSDPDYRQLSVRRLMTMIALTLERQAQWLVFEPNTPDLRAKLFQSLSQFLGTLYRRGAFAGDTEAQSFFVRCDESVNPPASLALGRLIAEVGVAPAVPLEYLVLRIAQDTDGTVQVVSDGG